MKLNIKSLIAGALLATVPVITASAQTSVADIQERGYIQIATANEIPYGFVDASGDAHGIAPDVAREVLASMGIEDIQWVVTQFGSLIPGLQAGRYDMVAAEQAILPARCEVVNFSRPSSSYGEGMLVANGNPHGINSYDAFLEDSSLLMGIVSGADQIDFAQEYGIPDNQLVMISSNTDALSAVQAGRIHGYAATGLTVTNLAEASDAVVAADPFETPVVDGEPVRSWGGFTFSLDNEELRDAFNVALEEFQGTDEWRQILLSHGLTNTDIDEALNYSTADLCVPAS